MKINLDDLTQKIEQQDYLQDLATIKYADLNKSKARVKEQASKMVREAATAIKHNSLSHIALEVTGQRPIVFALENNIINLPYSNYKKVANFFEAGKDYPVLLYFETQSDYLNASGFRIDQLATEEELAADEDKVIANLTTAIMAKLKEVREYQKPEPAAKKTVTKKSTTKTKKTATRTSKAKPAATKKPATKAGKVSAKATKSSK
ncbi:hypothetical protein [Lactobacillus xylocopicola]|uniref:Uncharacterized protein n=1 Tax=Lactobacillus xylocopicola TaxID=2976676 RepID=A0ABM8BIB4_9LACO|nr:hypothetical protein [Lactobacillus xylocopicola]BDR61048.1 hypothetical protein KIM322_13090 [Lactobacillus xylocopicola]